MNAHPAAATAVIPDAAANLTKYLDLKTAAAAIEVKPETLYRWIREGRIRVHRMGGKAIRIHVDDLEKVFVPEPLRGEPPAKRRPGRPRKHPVPVNASVADPP